MNEILIEREGLLYFWNSFAWCITPAKKAAFKSQTRKHTNCAAGSITEIKYYKLLNNTF